MKDPTEEDRDSLSVTIDAIQEKMDLLKTLDNEISAAIPEDDLENEVVETDDHMFAARKKLSLIRHKFMKTLVTCQYGCSRSRKLIYETEQLQ